jgi:hypothetical protein
MPTGIILAYSIPDGADVLIDGNTPITAFGTARTPAIIREVYAGIHNVTFMLPGYVRNTMAVKVDQGSYTTVNAILHPNM